MVIPASGFPCLPSAGYYARWIGFIAGRNPAPGPEAHPNRYTILSGQGREETLTIPVEGGRAALKKQPDPGKLIVSLHGGWWRTHCGAISAAYGREPYFPHYFPALERILLLPSEKGICTLEYLSERMHEFVADALFSGGKLDSLEEMRKNDSGRLEAIRREYGAKARLSLSIIDSLFRFGPASLFLL